MLRTWAEREKDDVKVTGFRSEVPGGFPTVWAPLDEQKEKVTQAISHCS